MNSFSVIFCPSFLDPTHTRPVLTVIGNGLAPLHCSHGVWRGSLEGAGVYITLTIFELPA